MREAGRRCKSAREMPKLVPRQRARIQMTMQQGSAREPYRADQHDGVVTRLDIKKVSDISEAGEDVLVLEARWQHLTPRSYCQRCLEGTGPTAWAAAARVPRTSTSVVAGPPHGGVGRNRPPSQRAAIATDWAKGTASTKARGPP